MTLTPKVTCEDVRLSLNGTVTGSTYYFWDSAIESGSVLAQINISNYWMYGLLGKTIMDSNDEVTKYHVKTCQLDHSCLRLLILLSGGVVTDGFDWSAGPSVKQNQMLPAYKNLIQQFKESTQLHLHALQPCAISGEWSVPSWSGTAPSTM